EPNMVVKTSATSPRVKNALHTVTELLLADHPSPCQKQKLHGNCELEVLAGRLSLTPAKVRFPRAPQPRPYDDSSLVIAVDHNACILCDRCIRGCNEVVNNQVLGRARKGFQAQIAFDLDTPMGASTCVACGECMVSCPTGALMNRSVVQPEPWKTETPPPTPVLADELAKLPLFAGVAPAFLRFNDGAVVRRSFKKGNIICREGDFGSSAFLIEKGTVNIFITSPFKHVKSRKNRARGDRVDHGLFGLVRRFSSALVGRSEDPRPEESTQRYIHVDAPVSLAYANPVAKLEAGDLFGEMTCMSNYPRSATVQAAEDCTVLEILRNVLYILQRSNRSRAWLEQRYRERAVASHLRSVPIFASLLKDESQFQAFVDFLRPRVALLRLSPGEVIFRQGDPAVDFYLVRTGFVKVSQNLRGGEHVLAYKGPGEYFGEIGLMAHLSEVQRLAPHGERTATCSALDHVDLVRVSSDDFRQILEQFPELRRRFVEMAVENLEDNERSRQQVQAVPLGDFLKQGLMNAQSLLVLDLEKCTRCDECTKACSDAHDGITRLIRDGLRLDKWLVASSCRSCLDPYCMVGCPVGSIRRRNSREIIIEDWCIGCGKCADNCPYGNINMHPFEELREDPTQPGRKVPVLQQKATMCDLCAELDGEPSCVYACPHDAAHRMTGRELLDEVEADLGQVGSL
ncbi:MAG TPA: cyclic nucleotide-binding domain-containing protein, partial [Gemmataceae bacterium]|nr:cyclic nucleotide-binding domain-containing protein [Gemmataceae bacterium]